jgi:hypothetical protein
MFKLHDVCVFGGFKSMYDVCVFGGFESMYDINIIYLQCFNGLGQID